MIRQLFKRTDSVFEQHKKSNLKSDIEIETVYGKEKVKTQTNRFHFAHFILKYKIMLPLFWVFHKIFGKKMIKTTPDLVQFKYIKMFERVFDKTVIDWIHTYLDIGSKKNRTREEIQKYYETNIGSTGHCLRLMKETMLTITTNDDAYMEFLPFFFHNIYFEMEKDLKENKPHLLHTMGTSMTTQMEKLYLSITQQIKEGKLKYEIKPCGIQTKNGIKKL